MKKIKIESPIRFVMFVLVLLALVVGVVYGAVYIYKQREDKTSTETLLEEVGKLVILPEGEDPSIFTVAEPETLRGQEFFKNTQAGDKLLLFAPSQKAILYRPSTKTIIEIAPINSTKP